LSDGRGKSRKGIQQKMSEKMSATRRELRRHLYPSEIDFEEWFYEVQSIGHSASTGILIRCMLVAAADETLPFWSVLDVAKKTVENGIELPELVERLSKVDSVTAEERAERRSGRERQ
jgi:hypothetical protein